MIKNQRGELGLTLAIISLVVMVVGSLAGTNLSNQAVKKSSEARGTVACGQYGCRNNSDCAQNTGFTVLCHVSSGQCRPSDPRDSCVGGTPRVDKVKKDVGQSCTSDADCKTGLYCGSVTRVCTSNIRPTTPPAPTAGGGGNVPAGSCVFAPTAFVKLKSGSVEVPFSSDLDSNVTNWTVVNSVGGAPLRFGANGSSAPGGAVVGDYCCGSQNNGDGLGLGKTYRVDKTAPYGDLPGSQATVTLSGFDTSKYRVVRTEGPGINGTSATIGGLPVGCSTAPGGFAYQYGWVLECTGTSCPQTNIPQPTQTDYSRFTPFPGVCEVLFVQTADPYIERVEVGRTGQAPLFTADVGTRVKSGDNPFFPFPLTQKNNSISVNFDPNKQPDVRVVGRNNTMSRLSMFDRQGLVPGTGAESLKVTIHYFVKKGTPPRDERHSVSAMARGGCEAPRTLTSTPIPSPTLTLTPKATLTPSPTTTVSPTLTVTPTATLTPTATPTVTIPQPSPCNENIHLLIDSTQSVKSQFDGIISQLQSKITEYVNDPTRTNNKDNITFTQYYFNLGVERTINSPQNIRQFQIGAPKDRHWTNIDLALRDGVRKNTIFVSDGIPSVVSFSKDGKGPYQCVFDDGNIMSRGGDGTLSAGYKPNASSGRFVRWGECKSGDRDCADAKSVCQQFTYKDAFDSSKSGNVAYSIIADGNSQNNRALMGAVGSLISINDLPSKIGEIIDNACKRDANKAKSKPASMGMSMRVQNNSNDRTISTLSLKVCDAGTTNCQEEIIQQPIAPSGSTVSNKSFMSIGSNPIGLQNNYSVDCNVSYADGGSDTCGARTVTGNDGGVRYLVNVDDDGASGESQTFLEASNLNDDKCVNVLDYVMLIKQLTLENQEQIEAKFDLVLGDGINASDISVMIDNLGKPCSE